MERVKDLSVKLTTWFLSSGGGDICLPTAYSLLSNRYHEKSVHLVQRLSMHTALPTPPFMHPWHYI